MNRFVESYEQAIEFLFSRINYERVTSGYSVGEFKLDRMREFLRLLGDPQESIPAIHIAGTKGKGSTAAMLAAVLTASGYRTGLFTSPHISSFEERMTVDGVRPTRTQLVELVNSVAETVVALDKTPGRMSPTYFEISTALAWTYFREQRADLVVLETGLGGRLDATNICRPEVTLITSISRDHMRQLGSRLSQIASEKAGIIKPGVPTVIGALPDEARLVVEEVCRAQSAPLRQLEIDFTCRYRPAAPDSLSAASPSPGCRCDVITETEEWRDLPLSLLGEHQARNTALAVCAVEELRRRGWQIPTDAVRRGLADLRWPGRIEVLQRRPTTIVDAAHNWAAVSALLQTLADNFPARRRLLVFAAALDKDVSGMLRQLLPQFDCAVLTTFQNNPRSVPVEELARLAGAIGAGPFHVAADPAAAWKLAQRLARDDDLICITGSFFIAAELRDLILDSGVDPQSGDVAALKATPRV
jgi:dihydrofolate synthase / folylpolyglutamate synthase